MTSTIGAPADNRCHSIFSSRVVTSRLTAPFVGRWLHELEGRLCPGENAPLDCDVVPEVSADNQCLARDMNCATAPQAETAIDRLSQATP